LITDDPCDPSQDIHAPLSECIPFGPVPTLAGKDPQLPSEPLLSQAGGEILTLVGSGWEAFCDAGTGLCNAGIKILIGPFECSQVYLSAPSATGEYGVRCLSTPSGAGGPHYARVKILGGVELSPPEGFEETVEYSPPTVLALSPDFVALTANSNLTFNVTGTGFGPAPTILHSISIGGNLCGSAVWISSTLVSCLDVPGNGFLNKNVVVRMASTIPGHEPQTSNGGLRLLSFDDPPTPAGVAPSELPASGYLNITLFGAGFGTDPNLISKVLIGNNECIDKWLQSQFSIICLAPPGTGRELRATIITSGGIIGTSSSGLVSYAAPVISKIATIPAAVFSATGVNYSLIVTGQNFGISTDGQAALQEAVPILTAGGRSCPILIHANDSCLICHGLQAPWSSSNVVVQVDG